MSIILKGIDLPKKGKTRRLEIFDDGSIYEDKGEEWQGYPQGSAIQIPKGHGRLIDADELKAKREWMRWRESNSTHEAEFVNSKYIDNAPTILEEEK